MFWMGLGENRVWGFVVMWENLDFSCLRRRMRHLCLMGLAGGITRTGMMKDGIGV